ncbi:MAG: hypothetical protein JSV00_05900 [bacterium]|nr:MAG: hypothetical protein JSV00_05900 [bacterium]
MIRGKALCCASFVAALLLLSGCGKPLPSTLEVAGNGRVLGGPVLALAGAGDVVVAANPQGVFIRKGAGSWERLEVPGIRKPGRVTSLAVSGDVIVVGTRGEGLHLLSEGTWEVKTARYGGLPDDNVYSLAFDGEDEGLPGTSLWVGTGKGIARRSDGRWQVFRPGKDWLRALAGEAGPGSEDVYVSSRFRLGERGQDARLFRPPVTAIGVGPERVVFGNRDSRLAVVQPGVFAAMTFDGRYRFSDLLVERSVIWAGTDKGLLWGGIEGEALGTPWPPTGIFEFWSGALFGSRDSRTFQYVWKILGYNTAQVADLALEGASLWVAYTSPGGEDLYQPYQRAMTGEAKTSPITDVRRYVNIGEYIARLDKPLHESYGSDEGMAGQPTALYVSRRNAEVWIGTTKGLYRLGN